MLATRIAKFGLVGIFNTALDFGIYNILTSKRFKLSRIHANIISTTIAMIFSFFANQRFVFKAQGGNLFLQIGSFYLVTAFGLYVLQNIIIHFLTYKWQSIPKLAIRIVHGLNLNKLFHDEFVHKNTVKLAATFVSLSWNFILFQYLVFHS